jgi:hypothetical protein
MFWFLETSCYFTLSLFICSTGDWILGLVLARQALYPWAMPPSLLLLVCFKIRAWVTFSQVGLICQSSYFWLPHFWNYRPDPPNWSCFCPGWINIFILLSVPPKYLPGLVFGHFLIINFLLGYIHYTVVGIHSNKSD